MKPFDCPSARDTPTSGESLCSAVYFRFARRVSWFLFPWDLVGMHGSGSALDIRFDFRFTRRVGWTPNPRGPGGDARKRNFEPKALESEARGHYIPLGPEA